MAAFFLPTGRKGKYRFRVWLREERASLVAQLGKNACNAGDLGSIPGEDLEKGMATDSSILA